MADKAEIAVVDYIPDMAIELLGKYLTFQPIEDLNPSESLNIFAKASAIQDSRVNFLLRY